MYLVRLFSEGTINLMKLSEKITRYFGDGKHRMHFLTLRFADKDEERNHNEVELLKSLPVMRIALAGAIAIYAIFSVLDYFAIPEIFEIAWIIRFIIVCPIFLAAALLTLHPVASKYAQYTFAFCMFMA